MSNSAIGIIYEHPQWHEPLFEMMTELKIDFVKIDLKSSVFKIDEEPECRLYYNLVSPSANLRNNQQAISYAIAFVNHLERKGCRVLNGLNSIQLEVSKSTQMSLLHNIGVAYPKSYAFNTVDAILSADIDFPQILKPEQGGSGSRIFKVHSKEEISEIFEGNDTIWQPDHLFILQDEIEYDKDFGIIRLEFIGGELLYAMRVLTYGSFNLCPSIICNPEEGDGQCEIPNEKAPEFFAYHDLPEAVLQDAQKIVVASGHDITSVEFAFDKNGKAVFYDINSNSNLRENVCRDFGGGNPFERVARYLKGQLDDLLINSDLQVIERNKRA